MVKKLKYIYLFLALVPVVLDGQHFTSCPLDHHRLNSYVNPLYNRWLSKYDVKFYHISLEVSNKNTIIGGFTTILSEAREKMDTIVFQLSSELTITYVEVNGEESESFSRNEDAIFIPVLAEKDELISVEINYHGDAGQNSGFFAGITSAYDKTNDQWVTYTLSEPLNALDWFPVKQVLTDKADSVWVDIICEKNLMGAANGLLKEIEDLPDGKHKFKWRSRYPIAYYLISIAVGDYRDYSFHAKLSNPEDSLLVQNFIYDDDDYLAEWKSRIDKTGSMITLFSDLVIDYPFSNEKYGHAVAPMGGGMEHQTMSTMANFNFNLVAHELAHQWFGNNITCGTWQDIWINEGFASYFEFIALENLYSHEAANDWMRFARSLAFKETGSVYVPESEADDAGRVFDYGLTYKKGAILLHMIRYELNNDLLFYDILKTYSELFEDGVATAEDFRQVLDSLSGSDFSCFFDQWYYGSGYPTYTITATTVEDTLFISSRQTSSSQNTPLFKMYYDLAVKTEKGDHIFRLFQGKNVEDFAIPVSGSVYDIQFDPEKKVLAKGIIDLTLPNGEYYLMGPNPFEESIMFKFSAVSSSMYVELYNMKGNFIRKEEVLSNPYTLFLSEMNDGPYLLNIAGPWGISREKIIKISTLK